MLPVSLAGSLLDLAGLRCFAQTVSAFTFPLLDPLLEPCWTLLDCVFFFEIVCFCYFWTVVSRKKQSICTLDNQGQFKQYNLDEGEKLTHRGEAPFKIQLNPSISELYFQGWKVILKEGDNFIQLNPVDMAIELN